MTKKVAIQGFEGSFHHEAANLFFGKKDIALICCNTFKQTFTEASITNNYGVVAIENSNAGSIVANYALLQKHKLQIIGEIYLKVKQQLLANKGTALKEIKEVQSHPIALLQCSNFLDKHHFKLIESDDTALSAKKIKQHHAKHQAAIASKLAAEIYDLDVIAENIHNDKYNTTRFLVLSRNAATTENSNKATLYFRTAHTKGALAKVLTIIAKHNINLSKLQSHPVSGSNFQYYFYADLEFKHINDFNKTITPLKACTSELHILGIYKNQKTS